MALPTGTVTFLFTDIEGSTDLLRALGSDYASVLARHRVLMRDAIARYAGHEMATEGDAFFVVFERAPDAVAAAVDAQRALSREHWPKGADLRVRMGLLTGHGTPDGGGYVGIDVHRAARIASAAHGGQVVVADSTHTLVERELPGGVGLADLGLHRLKDLPLPEHLFQLAIAGLPTAFPPLRSLSARPNNLPLALTSFIGREHEMAVLIARLESARLVTLTGPGGTGKTRLAVRAGAELLDRYRDGVWFVPLEAVTDPTLVPGVVARALGIHVPGDRQAIDVIETWAAQRQLLLILDNLEQLVAAAPYIARLLAAAAGVSVLATSRTPLHVYGESEYALEPLPVHKEAVRLFADRAAASNPDFKLDAHNENFVAEICAHVDGLPLAIELAAARVSLLTPAQITSRLERDMSLLSSRVADVPERQRTLAATIRWSVRLLSPDERRLFMRLGVFHSGVSLEAAEAVAMPGLDIAPFDGLASLVDKSLLRSAARDDPGDEIRFEMLETIREFAAAELAGDPVDLEATRRRHAAYFLDLALRSERELTGPSQTAWLDRLERENDNLRASFAAAPQLGLLDAALTAAGAMWRFWQQRNHFAEARMIFDRLLAIEGGSAAARAKALGGAGGIAYWQSDLVAMTAAYEEARSIIESLSDDDGLANALLNEAYVPLVQGDFDASNRLAERARSLFSRLQDELGVARAEVVLAVGRYFGEDYAGAIEHYADAAGIYRRKGELLELADVLNNLGFSRGLTGAWSEAIGNMHESIALFKAAGNRVGVAMGIAGLAAMAAWTGNAACAAELFGYVDATTARVGGAPPRSLMRTGGYRERARQALGEVEFNDWFEKGGQLSEDDAVALGEFELPPNLPPFPGLGGVAPQRTTRHRVPRSAGRRHGSAADGPS